MNSLIRYFGGKNGMANKIIDYFPNKEDYTTYIEPFGGSFGVALHNPNIPPIEIYNDLDQNVYSLFRTLVDKDMFNEFRKMCDFFIYSEQVRKLFKEDLKRFSLSDDPSPLDIIQRAFRFFYVNRTSINGIGGFSINTCIR